MDNLLIAKIALISLGAIGVIDEYIYHFKKEKLIFKKQCLKETMLHLIRYLIFAIVYGVIANFKFGGIFSLLMLIVLIIDISVSIMDIIEEPKSRESSGGLSGGEYLLHMILSFNLGIFYFNFVPRVITSINKPTQFIYMASDSSIITLILNSFAIGSLLIALLNFYILFKDARYKKSLSHVC